MHIENGAQAINITGVEISPDQVEIAKQNIPNATFYVGDIRVFPLPSETFDVATSNMVWEFLDDEGLEAGFRNVHGSLKPGGKLVTITTHPNRYIGKHGVTEPGWVNTKGPWNSNDERFENWYRTVDRFTELAQEAGFTIAVLEEPFLEIPEDAPDEDKAKFEESFDHFGFPARLVMVAQK
jgi:SAM-dependent methyltransferase